MSKTLFRLAFVACLAASGCASPMTRLFAKKQQPFNEYLAQRKAEQNRVATSATPPAATGDVSEWLNRGHAAFQQDRIGEAQSNYQAVLQRQPNHAVANHRLAVIADRQQDFPSAERYYQAALAAAPRDANLLNDAGYSYLLQSRFAEAERYLQTALQQSPTQTNAINNLGLLYARQGQPDRALAMFRRTSGEAEAQAKLSRLMPVTPAAQVAPQNVAINNGYPANNSPTWPSLPTGPLPGNTPPGTAPPNVAAGYNVALAGAGNPTALATNDPNLTEPARQLKERMDRERMRAVAERQARDDAERARRDALLRQVRDAERVPSAVQPAGGTLSNATNTWPNSAGPHGVAGLNHFAPQTNLPAASSQGNTFPAPVQPAPLSHPNALPHAAGHFANTLPSGSPAAPPVRGPANAAMPPATVGSPLDNMPAWPLTESLPSVSLPNVNMNSSPNVSMNSPNSAGMISPQAAVQASWPSDSRPYSAEDMARAASRMGMNAGPGNLFPITPGPTSNAPGSVVPANVPAGQGSAPHHMPTQWPGSPPAQFAPGPFSPPNGSGFAPQPSGPNFQNNVPPTSAWGAAQPGQPPEGSFGPGNFSTSQRSPQSPMTPPNRAALHDQLPPSEQFQTQTPFGLLPSPSATAIAAQPANFSTPRAATRAFPTASPTQQANELERAGTRATVPDRFGGDDRWEVGPAPYGQPALASVPIMQGYLPTTAGDVSMSEYERMIQQHNSETNLIRQQIDAQRQLPGSEHYLRGQTQPQTGTPTGPAPWPTR